MTTTYQPLEYTGERMVPEKAEVSIFWEHISRYRFAAPYVAGKRVLDIACGEGYGTAALLKAGAASVVGVDISEEACRHARAKYGVDARVGSAEAIPLPDQSLDVIVSFETIEHVPDPAVFLKECHRVLAPQGKIIISTPNKGVYLAGEPANPFHCSELTEDEFTELLNGHFTNQQLFVQNFKSAPWWSPNFVVAADSIWYQRRGFQRLTRMAHSAFCSYVTRLPREDADLSPVQEILKTETLPAAAVNPYRIRRRAAPGKEQGLYFVAVAEKQSL